MKRFLSNLLFGLCCIGLCCLATGFLYSCSSGDEPDPNGEGPVDVESAIVTLSEEGVLTFTFESKVIVQKIAITVIIHKKDGTELNGNFWEYETSGIGTHKVTVTTEDESLDTIDVNDVSDVLVTGYFYDPAEEWYSVDFKLPLKKA